MKNAGLLAAAMLLAAAGRDIPQHAQSRRPTGDARTRILLNPPRRDTELQREIAEHNAAIDARKAENRARKAAQGQEPG